MNAAQAVETVDDLQRQAAYTTPRPDVFELVPPSARSVLDLGCSNGAFGHSLKRARPDRQVFGVEFDAAFAAEAGTRLDRVIQGDLNRFDWAGAWGSQRFDCIVFADVLEHLAQPADCLRQAVEYLQPGGCAVVSLPNVRHLPSFTSIFVSGTFPRRDRGLFDRTHLRWFTLADARRLIEDSGLAVEAASYGLRWGDRGGGLVNRVLNRLPPSVQHWGPVREFLTYQGCFRARRSG